MSRNHSRLLVSVLFFLGGASVWAQTGSLSGTVVAQRETDDGHSVLVRTPLSIGGEQVTMVRIEVPRKIARDALVHTLPDGWTMTIDKGWLVFSGPPLTVGDDLALGAVLGNPLITDEIGVNIRGGGGTLAKGDVPLTKWPEIGPPLDPDEVTNFPPVVPVAGPVGFDVNQPDLPPGTWEVGEDEAVELDTGGFTVNLGYTWETELKLDVSYTDLWGETLVDGTLDEVELVPAGDPEDPPRITDCSPKILSGGTLCVCGYFPTFASQESLTLNGRPLGYPKSSSEWILTFQLPEIPPGEFTVVGPESAGYPADSTASGIHIAVGGEIDRDKLMRGDSTPLKLWLEGTEEPMTLHLWNATPAIVTLDGGNDQMVTTSGGSPNQLERTVHAVSVGDFTLSYELSGHWCSCAETIAEEALSTLGDGSTVTTVSSDLSSTTDPCSRSAADCERLRLLAEAAGRIARSVRAEADRLEANRRWTESEADWIRESGQRTNDYVEVLRRQAGEWRELAENAREMARKNRERDETYPGTGWDYWAEQAERDAARRDVNAERLEAEIAGLGRDAEQQGDRADELERAISDAEEAAAAAEVEAAKARAAYAACLGQLRTDCPSTETGTILYDGPVTVTEGGDDPRDVDPTDPEARICGPDITDYVLGVLDRMIDDYDQATATKRAEACDNITTLERNPDGVMIAEYAWDIYALSPGIAPDKDGPKKGETYWYEDVSDICAHPRYPCGATVTFLGQCIHSQVVNYIQWGAMIELCDQDIAGDFMHWARATAGGLKNWEWKAAHYETQGRMSEMGAEYVNHRRNHDADQDFNDEPEFWTPEKLREMRADLLGDVFEETIAGNDDWSARDAQDCAMICRLTPEQESKIGDKYWGYNWLGLRNESPEQSGIRPKRNR